MAKFEKTKGKLKNAFRKAQENYSKVFGTIEIKGNQFPIGFSVFNQFDKYVADKTKKGFDKGPQ